MSTAYTDVRAELPEIALSLPAGYYTDPDRFRRELEAIHLRLWLYAGRTEELPEPGCFVVREIGGASVIVVREQGGRLHAMHNSCRHRGTLLCNEAQGRLAGRIQCPYHGWTYGLDGSLLGAPHMDKVRGFQAGDWPLLPVAVDVWDGHFFLNFSPHPPPLAAQLEPLPEKFGAWRMEKLRRVERRVYALRANWKLIVQNYSECLHCPLAHPQLHAQSHYMSGDNDPPGAGWLGGRMRLREGFGTLTLMPGSAPRPLPGLGTDEARHVYYYAVLPNLLLNLHPDYMLTFALWPRAVDRTEIVCEWHFHPDEIGRPGFDPSGAIEFWELTNRQDWELSERAQAGISSRGYRPGPFSHREELLLAFDRFVLDRLGESS